MCVCRLHHTTPAKNLPGISITWILVRIVEGEPFVVVVALKKAGWGLCLCARTGLTGSDRVLLGNVHDDGVKGQPLGRAIPLPPHKFVQIPGNLMCVTPFHPLQLCLHTVPI